MKLCPRCERNQRPKGLRFCNECAREINAIRDDPMTHMRALRALVGNRAGGSEHGNGELANYGALSILHPEMSHRRKRQIVRP